MHHTMAPLTPYCWSWLKLNVQQKWDIRSLKLYLCCTHDSINGTTLQDSQNMLECWVGSGNEKSWLLLKQCSSNIIHHAMKICIVVRASKLNRPTCIIGKMTQFNTHLMEKNLCLYIIYLLLMQDGATFITIVNCPMRSMTFSELPRASLPTISFGNNNCIYSVYGWCCLNFGTDGHLKL